MSEVEVRTVLFDHPGARNTERTLSLAGERARQLGLSKALVASTTGETGVRAVEVMRNLEIIVVTHSVGFKAPNTHGLTAENRAAIESAGVRILTCQHAFGGGDRAVRMKLGTYCLDEIIAYTLRLWGQGIKVIAEIALMAADAGLVTTDQPVIAIAGTGRGADAAAVVVPSNAQAFFDLKMVELICRPSPDHLAFGT